MLFWDINHLFNVSTDTRMNFFKKYNISSDYFNYCAIKISEISEKKLKEKSFN